MLVENSSEGVQAFVVISVNLIRTFIRQVKVSAQ